MIIMENSVALPYNKKYKLPIDTFAIEFENKANKLFQQIHKN